MAIGEAVFPSTKGYVHFQFSDYSKLTIIGVIIACAAWPIVTRISSAPRWLFFRLAIVVTLVLLLPDLYILHQGQPPRAVAVLMCMHLAIAVVTYNALVRLAPVRPRAGCVPPRGGSGSTDLNLKARTTGTCDCVPRDSTSEGYPTDALWDVAVGAGSILLITDCCRFLGSSPN